MAQPTCSLASISITRSSSEQKQPDGASLCRMSFASCVLAPRCSRWRQSKAIRISPASKQQSRTDDKHKELLAKIPPRFYQSSCFHPPLSPPLFIYLRFSVFKGSSSKQSFVPMLMESHEEPGVSQRLAASFQYELPVYHTRDKLVLTRSVYLTMVRNMQTPKNEILKLEDKHLESNKLFCLLFCGAEIRFFLKLVIHHCLWET